MVVPTIGKDCVIMPGVILGENTIDSVRRQIRDEIRASPVLGRGVFVRAGAKIIGPVFAGDRSKIGANAVVLEDVPAGATPVGIPARIARVSGNDDL